MEHRLIPPNIYYSEPNPDIPLDKWSIAIPTTLTPWPVTQNERRMSVSGFGMGGTNGHVVLESYTPARIYPPAGTVDNDKSSHSSRHNKERLFVISSQDQAGFKRMGNRFAGHLDSLGPTATTPEYLANLAHTFATARSGLSWRASFIAESAAELREKLLADPGENATRGADKAPRIG